MTILHWIGLAAEPDRLAARRVIRTFLAHLFRTDAPRSPEREGGR